MQRRVGLGVWAWTLVFATDFGATASELPDGYWDLDRSAPILEKTQTITLAPELGHLNASERATVERLLEAGQILHALYEEQKHPQARSAAVALAELDDEQGSAATQNLLTLYRLFKGPIATTLENERLAFLPVPEEAPGRNVYPAGISREELDAFLARHPQFRDPVLDGRSVVRQATPANLDRDMAVLERYPLLEGLHPGLREALESTPNMGVDYYVVPYSVAYADSLMRVYALLAEASRLMEPTDPDFAAFLRLRARDLLSDDYEGGDAAWVLGQFGNLNAQIGSYETYDDKLYGVKTFFSLSVLARDPDRTRRLEAALADIQAIEDSLPYDDHKRVRDDIPVGVYQVIADFGQARGANTASILPNDANHARKYGRTILLRYNIMTNPERFAVRQSRFTAAVDPEFHDDLTMDGLFQRTLWHEIGHYLGVDQTEDGRDLDTALAEYSDLLEEMKADLVSTYAATGLHASGHFSDDELRAIYAGGILRVLQDVKPRREQPYQTMQLMQWNYFLANGVLVFDGATGRLRIDYDVYAEVVSELLSEVLAIQRAGDPERAAAFVERYANWNEDLHEIVAARIRAAQQYRYVLVKYSAIDG